LLFLVTSFCAHRWEFQTQLGLQYGRSLAAAQIGLPGFNKQYDQQWQAKT